MIGWRGSSGFNGTAIPPARMIASAEAELLRRTVALLGRERLLPDLDVSFPVVAATRHATLSNAWHYRTLLRAWRPDVLVTCNWGAMEFALANFLPVAARAVARGFHLGTSTTGFRTVNHDLASRRDCCRRGRLTGHTLRASRQPRALCLGRS